MDEQEAIDVLEDTKKSYSMIDDMGSSMFRDRLRKVKQAIDMAIEALRKQIPAETVEPEPSGCALPLTHCCPVCGNIMFEREYCDECGQKLLWKGERDGAPFEWLGKLRDEMYEGQN